MSIDFSKGFLMSEKPDIFEVVENVFMSVSELGGETRVDLRKFYQDKKDNERWKPTRKGINLTVDEFNDLVAAGDDMVEFLSKHKIVKKPSK